MYFLQLFSPRKKREKRLVALNTSVCTRSESKICRVLLENGKIKQDQQEGDPGTFIVVANDLEVFSPPLLFWSACTAFLSPSRLVFGTFWLFGVFSDFTPAPGIWHDAAVP